jgi:beta-xylosidase/Pyruvate/2-oxoacid:ferredoxin oxidoreductase gamma subunit
MGNFLRNSSIQQNFKSIIYVVIKAKALICISLFLLYGNYSSAQLSNQSGTNGVTTYINAVQPEDNPDQTLMKVGNDFYSTGSSFHFTPYVSIRHSTDLVHWEVIARVVPSNWSGLASDATAAGIWEGALANFGGYFWVYFSNSNSGGQYFCKATSMTGPWSAPTKVTGSTVTGYDNSIFVDDDGTPYMLMKNGQSINRIQQIDKTTGQVTGTLMNMDWINANNRYSWAEGPVMCKRNGRYYYFMAGDVSGGQYCMSSATLTADESSWTQHGNFFSAATSVGGFTGPNHISQPVQIADGTWWCLSHAYDNSGWYGQGRQSLLHQVIWDSNGIPHGVPPNTNPVAAPNLPSSNISINLPRADDFTSTTLAMNWHFFNKANATKYSLTANPGYMRLAAGTGTTHILQKEGGHYYSMVTKVNLNATADGNQAGLRIMNGKDNLFATLYTGYNGGQKIGFAFNGSATEVNNSIGSIVWLKIERSLHTITGFYSGDGKTWTQIGGAITISTLDNYSTNYNEWVGTSIGLYATGVTADFDSYMYRDGFSPIKAVGHNNHYGVTTSAKTPGNVVSNSTSGDWFVLAGVSIGQEGVPAGSIQVNAASASGAGSLEVWIDNIGGAGTQIATIPITNSGGADVWKDYTANINASGQHDVYVRFIGAANSIGVNTIRFLAGTTCSATITTTTPTTFCSGGSVILTASAGSSYKWMNGTTQVGTASTYSATTAGSYTVQVTTAGGCSATSAATVVTVNSLPVITPYAQIDGGAWNQTSAATLCAGSTVVFGPQPVTTTGWSWTGPNGYSATSREITLASVTTSQGGIYTASYTDGNTCKSTATFTLTVNALPSVPTVTTPVTYCQSATATQLAATGTNLKWYTAATGGTGSTTAPTPITSTVGTTNYYVSQTTNTCESARTLIVVTVNALPSTPTVTAPVSYCQNATATQLAATGTNLKWYTAATGGTGSTTAPTPTTATAGTTNYYVSQTTNTCESARALIPVTVNAIASAPAVTTPVTYCQNATATQLTATGTSLKWYTVATGGTGSTTAPTPTTATAGTTNYYVSQTTNTCETTRTLIAVTVNAIPNAPTVTTPVTYCQNTAATQLTATGTNLKWYTAATGGTGSMTAPTPITATAGTTNYYVSQTTNTCESTRALIAVTVNALPSTPAVTTPVPYCQNSEATQLTATGTNLKWYTAATGGTGTTTAPTPTTATVGTTNYYVSQTTNACESARALIAVTVNAIPSAPVLTTPVTHCQNAMATQLTATGTNLKWYTVATGGTGTTTAPTPTTATVGTTNYYVSQTTNTCESARALIAVTVNALPTAIITANGSTAIVQGSSVVLTASSGSSYQWMNGTTAIIGATAQTYTATDAGNYSVEVTNSNSCTAISASTDVTVSDNQPSLITITSPQPNTTISGAIDIAVDVTDPDGSITLVEFLDGNTVIGTSTTAPYTFTWDNPSAGTHSITVRVTDSNGGVTTSAVVNVTSGTITTGVQSMSSIQAVIYPNPSSGDVYIETSTDLSGASFTLIDVLGREVGVLPVITGSGARIDVSGLSEGTYVCIIRQDNAILRNKITVIK